MIDLAGPALALLLVSTAADPLEQALWERVETENTIAVMEVYLELFPDGQTRLGSAQALG